MFKCVCGSGGHPALDGGRLRRSWRGRGPGFPDSFSVRTQAQVSSQEPSLRALPGSLHRGLVGDISRNRGAWWPKHSLSLAAQPCEEEEVLPLAWGCQDGELMSGAVLGECPPGEQGWSGARGASSWAPWSSSFLPLSPLRSSCSLWPPGQHCPPGTLGPFSGGRTEESGLVLAPSVPSSFLWPKTRHGPLGMVACPRPEAGWEGRKEHLDPPSGVVNCRARDHPLEGKGSLVSVVLAWACLLSVPLCGEKRGEGRSP